MLADLGLLSDTMFAFPCPEVPNDVTLRTYDEWSFDEYDSDRDANVFEFRRTFVNGEEINHHYDEVVRFEENRLPRADVWRALLDCSADATRAFVHELPSRCELLEVFESRLLPCVRSRLLGAGTRCGREVILLLELAGV